MSGLFNVTFSIRSKLFMTLLLATGSVVLCMYLVMLWSFDQGFLDYINKQEEQKQVTLSQKLSAYWQEDQGWKTFTSNPREWERVISDSSNHDAPPHRPPPHSRDNRGLPPHDQFGLPPHLVHKRRPPPKGGDKRPFLLDQDKRIIIGPRVNIDDLKLYPINVDEHAVGYLGLLPRKELSDELDLLFVEQQSKAFMLVAFVMVIICVLAGLPIAAHLVKPIKHLSKGTQRLINGHFKTVIPVTSHDELGLLSKNFNTLALTLRENEKARQQWIADISHELRTPLAILKAEIEAIQDGVRPSTPEALDSLHAEVVHLNHLINDLYELSMSDIGALNYQKTKVNPLTILDSTLSSFEKEFEQNGLLLERTFETRNDALVFADSARLKQLFSNIFKNTLRYTDSPGKLVVDVTENSDGLSIDFKDSTPGVNNIEMSRLFDRLYRVESSRNRATGGAGLGLSICKNIVTAHEGDIHAQASPYGGIWISVQLPLSAAKNKK